MDLPFRGRYPWKQKSFLEKTLTIVFPPILIGLGLLGGYLLLDKDRGAKPQQRPVSSQQPGHTQNKPAVHVDEPEASSAPSPAPASAQDQVVMDLSIQYRDSVSGLVDERIRQLKIQKLRPDWERMSNQNFVNAITEKAYSSGINGIRSIRSGKGYVAFRPLSDAFLRGKGEYVFDAGQLVSLVDMLRFKDAKSYSYLIFQDRDGYGIYMAVYGEGEQPSLVTSLPKPSRSGAGSTQPSKRP